MMSAANAVISASTLPGAAELEKKMDLLDEQVQHLNLEQLEALLKEFTLSTFFNIFLHFCYSEFLQLDWFQNYCWNDGVNMLAIALQDTDDALLDHDLVQHYKSVEDLLYAKSEQGEDI